MTNLSGYYIYIMFSDEKVNVKYNRQTCIIATPYGLEKGYLFVPINSSEVQPIVTSERNGDAFFYYVPEEVKLADTKKYN